MATRNIVPRADGEGQIGTENKKWQKMNTETITADTVTTETITADTVTTETITADTVTTETITADTINGDGIPVGDIVYRPYLKDGYIKADGSTVNRTDYPRLVALADKYSLWTDDQTNEPWKFGNGDGSTTMTVPNYKDRVVQGGDTADIKEAGLPEISGSMSARGAIAWQSPSGALYEGGTTSASEAYGLSTVSGIAVIGFRASRSNSIYGNSTTVQPPAIVLIPQMKY